MEIVGLLIYGTAFGILGFITGASLPFRVLAFVRDYQTIISGAFAMMAAYWAYNSAILPISQSTADQKEIKSTNRRTSYYLLPTALTIAIDQIKSDYDFLADIASDTENKLIGNHKSLLGDDILDIFRFVVQNIVPHAARRSGEILSQIQICRARSSRYFASIADKKSGEIDKEVLYGRLIDLLKANALIESMWNHARDHTSVPREIDSLSFTFSFSNLTQEKHIHIHSELESRIEKQLSMTVDLIL